CSVAPAGSGCPLRRASSTDASSSSGNWRGKGISLMEASGLLLALHPPVPVTFAPIRTLGRQRDCPLYGGTAWTRQVGRRQGIAHWSNGDSRCAFRVAYCTA